MSIPFYIVAPTTATVVKPAFTAEKQHMILAVKNDLIPTSLPFLEFTSAADYALSFGQDETYQALVKYFGFYPRAVRHRKKPLFSAGITKTQRLLLSALTCLKRHFLL